MILHGQRAVEAAEKELGRKLKAEYRRACFLEGYADEVYLDTKGIKTYGMGQTGEWIHKGLAATLAHHEIRAIQRLRDYTKFPEYLRAELFQAEYRGDLGLSPVTCSLINSRQYRAAANEFLNNSEYRTGPQSIRNRMEAVALALSLYDRAREA